MSSSLSSRRTAPTVSAEPLLVAILETSDDAIFTSDASGRIAMWNQTAERVFGHSSEDIVGRCCVDLFADHLRDEVESVLLAGDRVSHYETEVLRGDGMPVPISLSLCPVHEDGSLVATLIVARDITEQRLAQASLAEIEARVRDSEALAKVGSWMWDVRTGTVQWSDEFHRMHGVDPLDFDGTLEAHLRTIHSDDRAVVHEGMRTSVAAGRAFDHQYRIVRPDGEERVVHVRAQSMVGSDGTAVGLRGIGQDVTDRQ